MSVRKIAAIILFVAQAGVAVAAQDEMVNGTMTPSTSDYAQLEASTGVTSPQPGDLVNGTTTPSTTDYAQ